MTASRPRRTQAQRRAASESALLRAAAELIAERGIDRTSLRSVGERAGISRAMPAYHFGSKDGLIARLVDDAYEQTFTAAADALAEQGRDVAELPQLDALVAIIDIYLARLSAGEAIGERAVVVLWGAAFPGESPLPAVLDADRHTHRQLARMIADGQGDGSVRRDLDPDAAAVMVMGLARGAAAMLLTQPGLADGRPVRDLCGRAISAALAPD